MKKKHKKELHYHSHKLCNWIIDKDGKVIVERELLLLDLIDKIK